MKGAIAESGLIDGDWALASQHKARRVAERLAQQVGCNLLPTKRFLECLQETDPEKLILAEVDLLVMVVDYKWTVL